jgi:hypothetical protein
MVVVMGDVVMIEVKGRMGNSGILASSLSGFAAAWSGVFTISSWTLHPCPNWRFLSTWRMFPEVWDPN